MPLPKEVNVEEKSLKEQFCRIDAKILSLSSSSSFLTGRKGIIEINGFCPRIAICKTDCWRWRSWNSMSEGLVIHETSNYCTVFTLSRSFLHKPNLDSLLSTQLNKNSSYWFKLWSDYSYTSLYSNLSPLHHHLTYSSVPVWLLLDPSSSISLFLLVSRYLSAGTRVSVVSIFAAILSNVLIAIL